jgi:hypothetical protein
MFTKFYCILYMVVLVSRGFCCTLEFYTISYNTGYSRAFSMRIREIRVAKMIIFCVARDGR